MNKEKIQALKDEYELIVKSIQDGKLTPYAAGHADALTHIIKRLGELLK